MPTIAIGTIVLNKLYEIKEKCVLNENSEDTLVINLSFCKITIKST